MLQVGLFDDLPEKPVEDGSNSGKAKNAEDFLQNAIDYLEERDKEG